MKHFGHAPNRYEVPLNWTILASGGCWLKMGVDESKEFDSGEMVNHIAFQGTGIPFDCEPLFHRPSAVG